MADSRTEKDDGFAKGIVGKPAEFDGIREDAQQLVYGGGHFETEKAGLEDGVSLRETVDPDYAEPTYNYAVDPMTGSAPERKTGRDNNHEVSGKNGNKFEVGEM